MTLGESGSYPRWARWLVIFMTAVVNMMLSALGFHAWIMLTTPEYLKDGQYILIFPIAAAIGFLTAIPSILLVFWFTRVHPEFSRVMGFALLIYTIAGLLLSAIGSAMGGGMYGLFWMIPVIFITSASIVSLPISLPLAIILLTQGNWWRVMLFGIPLLLVVVLTCAFYLRSHRQA